MSITQNGRTLSGQGFVRQVENVSFVGAFWISDGGANDYFFSGTFVRGFAGWSGQGRYQPLNGSGFAAQWTMASAPCPAC